MKVRFISHAGIIVSDGASSVALDPWFFSSHFQAPMIESLSPDQRTIDFQVHPAVDDIRQFHPQAILCSHLHTHHAPITEIQILIAQNKGKKKTVIGIPEQAPGMLARIEKNLGSVADRAVVQMFKPRDELQVGTLTIRAFGSSAHDHLGWWVKSKSGSVMHLADSSFTQNYALGSRAECWDELAQTQPDLLFLSCGGTSTKRVKPDGKRYIVEHSIMSPVQAAYLTQFIGPKFACPMGFYNYSIWYNRAETTLPSHFVEDQFQWAVSFLAPETRVAILRPGMQFNIAKSLQGSSQITIEALRGQNEPNTWAARDPVLPK